MKTFKGKVIYNPSGKAGEYSYWAANFYNGCSARCEYCYNRKGIVAKVLGGDVPTLKKCLKNEEFAEMQFLEELTKNIDELRKHGLFFNFVSDPFLPKTYKLNLKAMAWCDIKYVPIKVLTKQTWWVDAVLERASFFPESKLISIGFTLTGHNELEPGAATNLQRILAMKKLHNAGFKTWASIEPIIDLESSAEMIKLSMNHCDLYKIGLQSGKRYDRDMVKKFVFDIGLTLAFKKIPIYWKDSILKQAGINREDLPSNCVNRNFNL